MEHKVVQNDELHSACHFLLLVHSICDPLLMVCWFGRRAENQILQIESKAREEMMALPKDLVS